MKTFHLNETDLEWSLKHLLRFYSSDFFPKEFEFEAIKADWPRIKEHLIGLDIAAYVPKTPLTRLAPKANGTFRAVHQLDPLDALIYTALVKRSAESGIWAFFRRIFAYFQGVSPRGERGRRTFSSPVCAASLLNLCTELG
jgi:hypothetical protein